MAWTERVGDVALTNAKVDNNFRSSLFRYGAVLAGGTNIAFTDNYNYFHISGTADINTFTSKQYDDNSFGSIVVLVFDGASTLKYDVTKLVLPTNADIVCAAGDTAIFVQKTAAIWECIHYQRDTGAALDASSDLTVAGNLTVEGHAHFGTKETVTSSAAPTIDWAAGNKQYVALTHDASAGTITMTDPAGAASLIIEVTTSGSGTITAGTTWATGGGTVYWYGGTAPVTTSPGRDIISFYFDGADYYGSALLDFS